MDVVEKIRSMIEPSLSDMGYDIVQIKLMDGGKRKTLSVMAERADGIGMSFDDCTDISRTVSALLDVEDPITSAYNLEVMSPGVDRPLTKFSDFEKYSNNDCKLETLIPIDGRKRFKGTIAQAKNNEITLETSEGTYEIPFTNIRNAKLSMNDAMLANSLKQSKKRKS
jgi:ribosome maturation factor RimP